MRNTLAGIAIGASVGLLVGLSVSPIAGAVVTTLLSVLVAYLGLAPALLLSITLRTHDGLSPSPLAQVERWKAAGFTNSEAKDLVVLERFGSLPPAPRITEGVSPKPGPKDEKESSRAQPSGGTPTVVSKGFSLRDTILFRTTPAGSLDCEMVRSDRFDRVEDRLEAMSSRPAWGDVVGAARRLQGADAQAAHLEEQWRAKCGE